MEFRIIKLINYSRIKKTSGNIDAVNFEPVTCEGYEPKGVAVIVKVLTDNRNRAAANVRNAFTKGGGNMDTSGCVAFLFEQKGLIFVEKDKITEERLMLLAIENGAKDLAIQKDGYEILTSPETFSKVRAVVENEGIFMAFADVTMLPQTCTTLINPEDIKKMRKLLDLLHNEDDVQQVYHNGVW